MGYMGIRMDDSSKIYTIILNDGTKLTNLRISCNRFMSQNIIDINIFKNNLKEIRISDGTNEKKYENVYLEAYGIAEDTWSWFSLDEKDGDYMRRRAYSIDDIQLALAEIYESIIDKNEKEGM